MGKRKTLNTNFVPALTNNIFKTVEKAYFTLLNENFKSAVSKIVFLLFAT